MEFYLLDWFPLELMASWPGNWNPNHFIAKYEFISGLPQLMHSSPHLNLGATNHYMRPTIPPRILNLMSAINRLNDPGSSTQLLVPGDTSNGKNSECYEIRSKFRNNIVSFTLILGLDKHSSS
jgi:hypothetical protein